MKNAIVLVLVGLLVLALASCQMVSGDTYSLGSGQTLTRDLAISGGSSRLEPGSHVTGSVWVTGGSLKANGEIDGDITVTGGSINFGPGAVVRGVVRRTGGGIHIAEGARVQPVQSYAIVPPAPVQEFLDSAVWHSIWPLVFLVPGLLFFGGMIVTGTKARGLAMTGTILTMLGLLFLYQNTFNHFESWAYAWALIIPTCIGIGLYIQGRVSDLSAMRERGIRITRAGLILFIILAVFFELVINMRGIVPGDLVRFTLPALLILVGGLVLSGRLSGAAKPAPTVSDPQVPHAR